MKLLDTLAPRVVGQKIQCLLMEIVLCFPKGQGVGKSKACQRCLFAPMKSRSRLRHQMVFFSHGLFPIERLAQLLINPLSCQNKLLCKPAHQQFFQYPCPNPQLTLAFSTSHCILLTRNGHFIRTAVPQLLQQPTNQLDQLLVLQCEAVMSSSLHQSWKQPGCLFPTSLLS